MRTEWADSVFSWTTFDVSCFLPTDWHTDLMEISKNYAKTKYLVPTSVTSREDSDVCSVPVKTVGGVTLAKTAPWLYGLYESAFLTLANRAADVPIYCAKDKRIAINLNVQQGIHNRYEAHVDSNPLEGLLYATTHPPGTGGELLVGLSSNLRGVDEIRRSSAIIYPIRGHLVFFDARLNPHFVEPLMSDNDYRLVVAMNYYSDECTEADRPADLNHHLGLDEYRDDGQNLS